MPKRTISGETFFEGRGRYEGNILVFQGQGRPRIDDAREEGHDQDAACAVMVDGDKVWGFMTLNCMHGVVGLQVADNKYSIVAGDGYWEGATGAGSFTFSIERTGVRANWSGDITTKA